LGFIAASERQIGMKKINVLFFESGEGFGGSAKSLFILLKNIDTAIFTPTVLVIHKGPFIKEIENLGVELYKLDYFDVNAISLYRTARYVFGNKHIITNNIRYYVSLIANNLFNFRKVIGIINRNKINVVHLNNGIGENLVALLAAKLLKKPIVAHVRGTEPLLSFEKVLCKWISFYFIQNRTLMRLWEKSVPKNRMVKIVNYIDFDLIRSANPSKVKEELGIPWDVPTIGFVGRLVEGKGVDIFLKAATKVVEQKMDARFIVVGSGPLEENLKALASDLGLSHNVIFTGWRSDVLRMISCFDVLIQATSTFPESFGNTIIEAMALNKPVIASKVSGPDEIVLNGETGFLVEPGNVGQLAEKIFIILDDKKLAKELGKNGRVLVENKYDVKKEMFIYEDIYRNLVLDN
jgi:glycosyltransferase involved in cell wall biosynthesis